MPQEEENWNPEAVWKKLRYQTKERWLDEHGQEFSPYSHYNVGGNTKFWGSVLYRLRREDFQAVEHLDGISPAWPIDYDTLEPYYERAERLYDVHGETGLDPTEPPRGPFPHPAVAHAPAMSAIAEALKRRGLHPSPLPLGLRDGCVLCRTCNSFACKLHAKSEAEVCCIRPALARPNVTLWTNACARRLVSDAAGSKVQAVEVERNGETDSRRRIAVRRIVRRRQLRGAAVAIRVGEAPERSGELVGARRHALHGASGDDDAGVSSASAERDRVSEDARDQRLLPGRTPHAVSSRTHPVARTNARGDGANRRPAHSAVGL